MIKLLIIDDDLAICDFLSAFFLKKAIRFLQLMMESRRSLS